MSLICSDLAIKNHFSFATAYHRLIAGPYLFTLVAFQTLASVEPDEVNKQAQSELGMVVAAHLLACSGMMVCENSGFWIGTPLLLNATRMANKWFGDTRMEALPVWTGFASYLKSTRSRDHVVGGSPFKTNR